MDKAGRQTLNALRSYTRLGFKTGNLGDLADRYTEESDRGLVVIFASVTEDELQERILQNFVELDPDRFKTMTRFGVLSGWANKTSLAVALGIIDEGDAEILEIMSVMRNACAHSRLHVDFRTPELRNVFKLLLGERMGVLLDGDPNVHGTRALFVQCCSAMWARIKGRSRVPYYQQLEQEIENMILRVRQKSSPQKPKKQSKKAGQSSRKK